MVVGDRKAYQVLFRASNQKDDSMQLLLTAIEGQGGFGSYLIFTASPVDDLESSEEILAIIDTFQVTGPVEVSTQIFSDVNARIRFMYDSALSLGGNWVWSQELSDGSTHYSLVIYPAAANTEVLMDPAKDNAGGIESMNASRYGSTPEEVLTYFQNQNSTFTPGERHTGIYGEVEWLIQDFTINSYAYRYGAASIDGEVFLARVMYDDSIQDAALTLWAQIMSSIRAL